MRAVIGLFLEYTPEQLSVQSLPVSLMVQLFVGPRDYSTLEASLAGSKLPSNHLSVHLTMFRPFLSSSLEGGSNFPFFWIHLLK